MKPELQQRYRINHDRPIIAVAPMAGVTDLPFRELCETMGADYSVTEMAASAPQLLASEKNQSRLHFPHNTRVKILQIIGNDAAHMAHAARLYQDQGAEIIDINFGCPAKKISKKGAGSALLDDLSLVADIIHRVRSACTVPVTLKTRLGTDHDNYTLYDVATIAADAGIELITVHGRTRACKFQGTAQFDEIARVKQAFPQLAIIANGDIDSVENAQRILEHTLCDGLMIGRAAVGNPWLFSDIRSLVDPEHNCTKTDTIPMILKHIASMHTLYGEVKGPRFARKHIQGYLQHCGLSEHFHRVATITSPAEQLQQLSQLLETYAEQLP